MNKKVFTKRFCVELKARIKSFTSLFAITFFHSAICAQLTGASAGPTMPSPERNKERFFHGARL